MDPAGIDPLFLIRVCRVANAHKNAGRGSATPQYAGYPPPPFDSRRISKNTVEQRFALLSLFFWTRRESNPRFCNANAAFYHLTTGPIAC